MHVVTVENFVTLRDMRPGIFFWSSEKVEAEMMRNRASRKISRNCLRLLTSVQPGKSISGLDGWVVLIIPGYGWSDPEK